MYEAKMAVDYRHMAHILKLTPKYTILNGENTHTHTEPSRPLSTYRHSLTTGFVISFLHQRCTLGGLFPSGLFLPVHGIELWPFGI